MDLEFVIQSKVSQKEKNKYCILTCMQNLEKQYRCTYFQGMNRDVDIENGCKRICKSDSQWGPPVEHWELSTVFCGDPDGWDGRGGEGGIDGQEGGGYMCTWKL